MWHDTASALWFSNNLLTCPRNDAVELEVNSKVRYNHNNCFRHKWSKTKRKLKMTRLWQERRARLGNYNNNYNNSSNTNAWEDTRVSQLHRFKRRPLNRLLIATRVFSMWSAYSDRQLYSSDDDARLIPLMQVPSASFPLGNDTRKLWSDRRQRSRTSSYRVYAQSIRVRSRSSSDSSDSRRLWIFLPPPSPHGRRRLAPVDHATSTCCTDPCGPRILASYGVQYNFS